VAIEIKIPESGESVSEVHIASWRKSEGDQVEADEIVAELESDKAGMDLPAPASGTLSRILKKDGDSAEPGETIAYIEQNGKASGGEEKRSKKSEAKKDSSEKKPKRKEQEESDVSRQPSKKRRRKQETKYEGDDDSEKPAAESEPSDEDSQEVEGEGESAEKSDKRADKKDQAEKREAESEDAGDEADYRLELQPRVMPAAEHALRQCGLTAEDVEGTGPGGRILREDVLRAARARQEKPAKPKATRRSDAEPDDDRPREVKPMSLIRRRIAERLVESQQTAALLTTVNEIDMSAVKKLRSSYGEAFKERFGVDLGYMPFFVSAAVEALEAFPAVNAQVRDENIVFYKYFDIGVAVATEHGLLVPVLRDADQMSFAEIEESIQDLAGRARDRKIKLEELRGGTFTITNGGVFGSLLSTPIVNPPQSAILGMHTIQDRPVARDGEIVIRPMMYVALTYDHRLIDGREAVLFLKRIKEFVESPARTLLGV